MKKFTNILRAITAAMLLFCFGVLVADKQTLRTEIIRMHVIANSDSIEDQSAKLAVRDAVMKYLKENLKDIGNISVVHQLIGNALDSLEEIANATLMALGSDDSASVSFTQEKVGKRVYDTFSLPAGVYKSLRIQIGTGEGKNWWCVVFPAFCVPTTTETFQSTAVSSGFDRGLVGALSNDGAYKLRFFLLECIGRIENFLINS